MLERLLLPDKHAISILMKDHDTVKELFDRFEKSESVAEKEKLITEALTELKIHAVIEEEIFYPALRKHVGKDLMNEADEEHHVDWLETQKHQIAEIGYQQYLAQQLHERS